MSNYYYYYQLALPSKNIVVSTIWLYIVA